MSTTAWIVLLIIGVILLKIFKFITKSIALVAFLILAGIFVLNLLVKYAII